MTLLFVKKKKKIFTLSSPLLLLLLQLLLAASSVRSSFASAFTSAAAAATKTKTTSHRRHIVPTTTSATTTTAATISTRFRTMSTASTNDDGDSVLRLRGGGTGDDDPSGKSSKGTTKKARIEAFDSMRFFLIFNIVMGHFVSFADPSPFLLRFFSHHNVAVGAFFALSGYVMAYTTTENAARAASSKLIDTPKQKWILQRLFGYYPLHLFVLALFGPMFAYADQHYNGWLITSWHAFLSVFMLQAWFPMHAEIWNAPTWYLGALSFVTACMPYVLPGVAKLSKPQLRRTTFWVFLAYALPKLGYLYDFNAWSIAEGMTSPKALPNLAVFNMQRFNPVFAVAEVLLGALACRLVMLDGADDEEGSPKTNTLSTLVPLLTIVGCMACRAADIGPRVSDLIFRSLVFVPLFLKFLMSAHRNVVNKVKDPVTSALSNKVLVWLGGLSFPIFIVHGPVGQMFYKKLIANKLFGSVLKGPGYFGLYLASTFGLAWILQKLFLQNKAVGDWSKRQVDALSEKF